MDVDTEVEHRVHSGRQLLLLLLPPITGVAGRAHSADWDDGIAPDDGADGDVDDDDNGGDCASRRRDDDAP